MSTFTCEPGARLGGRYRLEDRVSSSGGWSAWKAIDETLARPVTVLIFMPGFPHVREVVTAARAASRLTDARLAQVFDVEEEWDQAYVVMEWVGGDSLGDLLAGGPLEPGHAAWIIAEAAQAMAAAHAAGVAHLCLTPGSLRYTPGGGVKVVGLGIDAALSGTTADDPALADTRGLGRLLYAALTAHWPGSDWPGLPPAPEMDGDLLTPRQVCAGVPAAIDAVTCQALLQRGRRGAPPPATPALLAGALADVIPAPPPPPASRGTGEEMPGPGGDPYLDPQPWAEYQQSSPARGWEGTRRPRPARVLAGLAVAVVLAALGLGAWRLTHGTSPHANAGTSPSPTARSQSPAHSQVTVLQPAGARGFDPLSSPKQDPSNENSSQAKYAIDGDPHTAWHSEYFLNNPVFGGYSYLTGAGMIVAMPGQVRLHSVTVTFGPTAGANVDIEIGNSDSRSASTLKQFTTVATGDNLSGGTHTFTVNSTATGKYILIWFTKLPPQAKHPHHRYQAEIFNVVVKGSTG